MVVVMFGWIKLSIHMQTIQSKSLQNTMDAASMEKELVGFSLETTIQLI